MQTLRQETEFGTEIYVFADEVAFERRDVWRAYRIHCADFDYHTATDSRAVPTARINLLSATSATVASARQLAAEYAQVADIAEALEAEKRAAYVERFGEVTP